MFSLMETLMLKIDTFNIHKENFRQKENQIFSSSDWFGVFHFMKYSRTILIKSFIILLCKVCYKLVTGRLLKFINLQQFFRIYYRKVVLSPLIPITSVVSNPHMAKTYRNASKSITRLSSNYHNIFWRILCRVQEKV